MSAASLEILAPSAHRGRPVYELRGVSKTYARRNIQALGSVDLSFNVNVNTESSGLLLHNTGGHCDVANGAKVSIIVCPSIRGRLPMVRDEVTTITTPGETVGVVITERGIAVNDHLPDLKAELIRRRAPVKDIHQLRDEIYAVTGAPRPVEFTDKVVGLIEYLDGTIIDTVKTVRA